MTPQRINITLNDRLIVKYLAIFALFLTLFSIYGAVILHLYGRSLWIDLVNYLFNTNREGNVSSFFSALLLLISSVLLGLIYRFHKDEKSAFSTQWLVLTLGFCLMSFDEAVSVHELLVKPVRKILELQVLGPLYYAWVVPAMFLVSLLALYFYRFILHLPAQTRMQFLLSAFLFLGGCIGFEMVGGWYVEQFGMQSLTYIAIVSFEESFEMAGIILFIHSLLAYMKMQNMRFKLQAI